MGTCRICDDTSSNISKVLGLCASCVRHNSDQALRISRAVHAQTRQKWNLPEQPPNDPQGLRCTLCVNQCGISDGELGYCGLRRNVNGRLEGGSARAGNLSWYHDPLPTNCVGNWICPSGTGCGYPQYAYSSGPEFGYNNLAVFCHACTFNCLYCQNWQFRGRTGDGQTVADEHLVNAVQKRTACICYFGGDPTPQIPFLLAASRKSIERQPDRILRICWETNGSMAKHVLAEIAELTLSTGGCIKFDLKAWDETLHMALTGVTNRQTLQNFQWLALKIAERPVPPFLIASTLLVPGYIDAIEVGQIASFIAALNPDIPYSLLAFNPQHHMHDLPPTSRTHADNCLNAAKQAGLKRVKIGNTHLLW